MTLRVRNEEDILDAQLSYHLNAGVDFVVALDNDSTDGTTEILQSYARDGHLAFTQDTADYKEGEWTTQMARRAVREFDADWVVNSDADEFFWPRGGSLKDVLAAVPKRYGSVRGMWRHFAPRPEGDESFAERMTVRVCNPGADDNSPYAPRYKTVHRGHPDVEVLPGNHRALGPGLEAIPGWYPIDVLHFPMRSLRHFTEKYLRWWAVLGTRFGERVNEARQSGRLAELYESYVVDDVALAQGIANGTLAVDTRLRNALRLLRAHEPLAPMFADAVVDEAYLREVAALEDGDARAHAHRKVEDLEARLAAIETRPLTRIRKLVW